MATEFFGRQRECRFYTAGCGKKMVVSVTGPRAANESGGPVIPYRVQGTHLENLQSPSFHLSARNKLTCATREIMQLIESPAVNLGASGSLQNRALQVISTH